MAAQEFEASASVPGLHHGRLPLDLVEAAAREVAHVQASWLQGQLGENLVFHLNVPFPLAFPTAPVFPLGSAETVALEALAQEARTLFKLDARYPLHAMHAIVRIYSAEDGSHIGWHKDKRYFEDHIAGIVLSNTLPGGEGLRFRPDQAHHGAEVGLRESDGDCFMFEGEARHGWEHGFCMPKEADGHRRVTLTMRWYRLADPAVAAKLSHWHAEGMDGKVCIQFVFEEPPGADRWRTAAIDGVRQRAEPPKYVVPEDWSYEKLRRLATTKLSKGKTPGDGNETVRGFLYARPDASLSPPNEAEEHAEELSHRGQRASVVAVRDEAAWYELRSEHLASKAMRPVLRLEVDVVRECDVT